jgi:hypothetical protein
MTVGNAGTSDMLTDGRDDSQSTSGYYRSNYVWELYGSTGIQFNVPYMLKIEINQEPGVKLEMKNYTKGLNDNDSEYTYLSTYTSTHSNNINRGVETSTWYAGNNFSSNIRPFNGTIHSIKMVQIEYIDQAEPPQETWIPVIQNLNKTAFANAGAVTSGSGSIDTNLYSMGSSAFNSGGYNSSGRYLFRLVYGNDVNSPAYDFQWYQTTNPWEVNTSQVGAIEYPVGFSAPPSSDGRSFVGLGISSSSSRTLLDGTADGSWWYAVGIINHDLGNPGPNKTWYNNLNWYVWG